MKICKTEEEYIEAIVPAVQRVCKRYGYLPSVLIAQSCLENGYGIRDYWDNPQIEALLKYNNMVGIKSELLSKSWADKTVWPGESLTKQTPEYYGGKKVVITDNFRKYDDIEQSFADFLLFLKYAAYEVGGKPKYGDEVLSIRDPEKLIKAVHSRGYATGPTYSTNVMKIVNKHGLTKYDDLSKVTPTIYTPGYRKNPPAPSEDIVINRKYITNNNSYSTNNPVAIVIHNTDNFNRGADAQAHAEWLATDTDTGMSWHYAVDDHSIYQCLPHNRGAYHVGRNYGSNNLFSTYGGRDHLNTIAIEMCVNKGYDYEKAFQNTVKLTKYLMKQLNIPADRVFQHYDICSKDCPSQIRKHGDWPRFKQLISAADKPTDNTKAANTFLKAVKAVADKAKAEKWHYGDSHTLPPCADKTISCDRIVARALWDLGYHDQHSGGIVCNDMATWLHEHGFIGTTKKSEIKAGAVIAVGQSLDDIEHVFVVESYNPKTDLCRKYDTGSNERIQHGAYYTNVKLCEWSNRKFLAAWNVPVDLKGQDEPKPAPDPKPSGTVWNGVDYKPVYNYTYYRKKYADLRKAFGTDKAAYFKHFCTYGMKECRIASASFNVVKYKNRYSDLRKAFGDDMPKYYEHYCVYGKKEGRNAK